VPDVAERQLLRLCLDINVLVSDMLAKRCGRQGTAASMVVEAVRDGLCPAGPVQLVTSLPIIENYASVLQRRFGYSKIDADEKAWLLEQYAIEGPMPEHPHVVVGAGFIAFETEEEMRSAVETFAGPENAAKLFTETQDDRYVLETALAGRADILVTSDVEDFSRGPSIRLDRSDVLLFPFADRTLVIAKPSFVAYWLRQGVIPDASFVAENAHDFRPRSSADP
jgi:predicted nucleic acid-binding protein